MSTNGADALRPSLAAAGTAASMADMAALAPGQAVHEYRIDKVLGGGGFGITYLAQDINLQLPVAIKEYFPSSLAVRSADCTVHVRSADGAAQFDWGLERFIEEARALASFRHPNIVRVLRYFKHHGTAYIVMEYESGNALKHWLAQQQGLDQAGLLRLVYPLLDGLETVHRLHFLHRDIKPDNIYIRADGSPVLLDFGAARRVAVNQDMTNIVSPGFAPFEQYHSNGNQGPWTDIYSLGAVLYWVTTGRKPMESASRIQEDSMPKAVELGSRAMFGEALLQTIDWALSPSEKKRPQSVAELRQAFRQAESRTGMQHLNDGSDQKPPPSTLAPTHTVASKLMRVMDKNVMGTIMFLDLVAYSTHSVDRQVKLKTLFNELINKAIGGVDEASRIVLDTGDGAVICFLGDPEEALRSAQLLRDLLLQKYGQKLSMRVGLHLGPIRLLLDINQRVNVVGDGINVAQRIMDFSAANQIMVSRAYFDVISRITDAGHTMFEYLGARQDKHKRSHEVYVLLDPRDAPLTGEHDAAYAPTRLLTQEEAISPAELGAMEAELTRAIGPLAQVLVKKALSRVAGAQQLRQLLAMSIQDAVARADFLLPKSPSVHAPTLPPSASRLGGGTVSGRSSASVPSQARSQPLSTPAPSVRWESASGLPSVPVSTTVSATVLPTAVPTGTGFRAEQLQALERALTQHIGPLAKTLVRKESTRRSTWDELSAALSQHIDKPADRAQFLALVAKIRS